MPLERARTTWAAVLESFDGKRAFLLSYVEALAQAERSPELREQFARQYRTCRAQIAELVARSFTDSPWWPARSPPTIRAAVPSPAS